jgi:hypothetical protein
VWVTASTSFPTSVHVLSLPLKVTFNDSMGAETVPLNGDCESSVFISGANSTWYRIQGTNIMD